MTQNVFMSQNGQDSQQNIPNIIESNTDDLLNELNCITDSGDCDLLLKGYNVFITTLNSKFPDLPTNEWNRLDLTQKTDFITHNLNQIRMSPTTSTDNSLSLLYIALGTFIESPTLTHQISQISTNCAYFLHATNNYCIKLFSSLIAKELASATESPISYTPSPSLIIHSIILLVVLHSHQHNQLLQSIIRK